MDWCGQSGHFAQGLTLPPLCGCTVPKQEAPLMGCVLLMAPSLQEFKKCLDNGLIQRVLNFQCSCIEPRVGEPMHSFQFRMSYDSLISTYCGLCVFKLSKEFSVQWISSSMLASLLAYCRGLFFCFKNIDLKESFLKDSSWLIYLSYSGVYICLIRCTLGIMEPNFHWLQISIEKTISPMPSIFFQSFLLLFRLNNTYKYSPYLNLTLS